MQNKRVLIILNPNAGQKRANKLLAEIVSVFTDRDYRCEVFITRQRGDAVDFCASNAALFDLIVCIGGDGTLNEVVSGMLSVGLGKIPIGYIPAGSTNDFGACMKLSKDIVSAAKEIVLGDNITLDVGRLDSRYFTYVASFGAFTEASYNTTQIAKNLFGRFAYVLEGIKDIPSIAPVHLSVETQNNSFSGEYVFGAVSNSTSIGGIMTLDSAYVDMNDGLFEITLIRAPQSAMELSRIITSLQSQAFDEELFDCCSASCATFSFDAPVPWTLDGEFYQSNNSCVINNFKDAITLKSFRGDKLEKDYSKKF